MSVSRYAMTPAGSKTVNHQLLHVHQVGIGVGSLHELAQVLWHDLPAEAKPIFTPTTLLCLRHTRQSLPIIIDLVLAFTGNRERHRFVELELRTGIDSGEALATQLKVNGQFFAGHLLLKVSEPLGGGGGV